MTITHYDFKDLIRDLSFQSDSGRSLINVLYRKFVENVDANSRVKLLYKEWLSFLNCIYGNLFTTKEVTSEINRLGRAVGIQEVDPMYFLYILHTYYAFIVKVLAHEITLLRAECVKCYIDMVLSSKNIREEISKMEDGKFFRIFFGIENFNFPNLFSWYIEIWDNELEKCFRKVLAKIKQHDCVLHTMRELTGIKDIFKIFYENIFSRKLRHNLGEYFTPDWLAQLTLENTGFDGNPEKRILDPCCGTGTFLVEVIRKILDYWQKNRPCTKHQLLNKILSNVCGIDINPLAVLTARANYLMAISPLISRRSEQKIKIPVFLADSIITPIEDLKEKAYILSTIKGDFQIPKILVKNKTLLEKVLSFIEYSLLESANPETFSYKIKEKLKIQDSETLNKLKILYNKLHSLHMRGEDKIWIRVIESSFSPLFIGQFDYVVGNPPWIGWEFLSDDYKEKLNKIYLKIYRLFGFSGKEARLGHSNDDFLIVFTYLVIDKYLKNNGVLGFIVKQTLFKNVAGKIFRKFTIEKYEGKIPLKVVRVDDFVHIRPFDASSETAVITIKKGHCTTYPVDYIIWKKKTKGRISPFAELGHIVRITQRLKCKAKPLSKEEITSQWIILSREKSEVPAAIGNSQSFPYEIRHGIKFDLNSVFFVEILSKEDNLLTIVNKIKGSKKKLQRISTRIEPDLIFPILKPRNIRRKWCFEGYEYALVPQRTYGEDNENTLRKRYPLTYLYLTTFRRELIYERKSSWFKHGPFYSIFGIGEYTWKPYKVVWCRMGFKPYFVVISKISDKYLGEKLLMVDSTFEYIPLDKENEAHYVCAILNSESVQMAIKKMSTESKCGISKSIISRLKIPKFNEDNVLHKELSELSKKAHEYAKSRKEEKLKYVERRINNLVNDLLSNLEKSNTKRGDICGQSW